MLNENFNQKPPPPTGPRRSGQQVTDPRQLLAISLKNRMDTNNVLAAPSPLATAINKRRKKY